MPRYIVEREFASALPAGDAGRWRELVERNADAEVTWLHSYVSEDGRRAFCLYEGRSPEAIRRAATRIGLPVERITEVRVLDPYFYS